MSTPLRLAESPLRGAWCSPTSIWERELVNTTTVDIGGLQWLDYAQAGPRKAMALVTAQKRQYGSRQGVAWATYRPLLSGFRRAVSSTDPAAELDVVVGEAVAKKDWRGMAYREAVDGFLRLLPRGATGVRATEAAWQEADLRVVLRHLVGLRLDRGDLLIIAPYCKEPPLSQETADVLLYLMELLTERVLPGAQPVVFDTRRGKRYKLNVRTNRDKLDACVRGMAAGYLRQWSLAA
jgi:hypothetical protein